VRVRINLDRIRRVPESPSEKANPTTFKALRVIREWQNIEISPIAILG